jgi:hypothetical protein
MGDLSFINVWKKNKGSLMMVDSLRLCQHKRPQGLRNSIPVACISFLAGIKVAEVIQKIQLV